MLTLVQIKFCAEECKIQKSGELSVYNMCEALVYAQSYFPVVVQPQFIGVLGFVVEPEENMNGFRRTPVIVPNGTVAPWQEVQRLVKQLCDAIECLSPKEFFVEFEKIHPFVDGNGRVGQILFNYMNGTLDAPIFCEVDWNFKGPGKAV